MLMLVGLTTIGGGGGVQARTPPPLSPRQPHQPHQPPSFSSNAWLVGGSIDRALWAQEEGPKGAGAIPWGHGMGLGGDPRCLASVPPPSQGIQVWA